VYTYLEHCDEKDSSTYNAIKEQWTTLTHNLTQVVSDFRYVQVEHNNREKEMLREQYLIARPEASEKEISELMTTNNAADVLKNAFINDNTHDLEYRQAQKRLEDIKVIVDYIDQLCQLLRDIDQMVAGQADFVDRIEIDVSVSRENTRNMNVNLRKTLKSTRRWKLFKRILLLIVGVALLVLIIWVFNSVVKPVFFSKG
ncbi:SNARE protein Syntaxin 1, partial [Trachipleistophora hominis]